MKVTRLFYETEKTRIPSIKVTEEPTLYLYEDGYTWEILEIDYTETTAQSNFADAKLKGKSGIWTININRIQNKKGEN